ncbi:MAG TPA: hypothetical protein GX404_08895 [Syntrophomonadaceae bacterium]|nr:hypothetical protein [Syntrophomonadaceae bacterium]
MVRKDLLILVLICLILGGWIPISQHLLHSEEAFTCDNFILVQSPLDRKQ